MDQHSRLTEAIASAVQAKMHSFGTSINKLSAASGIPYVTLHRKLAGIKPFTTVELVAIAQALDTTASSFVLEAEAAA